MQFYTGPKTGNHFLYSVYNKEGKTLGLAEGSRQKALETARILKQLGDSTQKIIQATGLSQAEVEAIK